ncbi:MAG: response regulator [Pseudomonadota bacterium]
MKILVADDSAMVRMIIRRELESGGYQVFEAGDGLDAIEQMMRLRHVDLVTLDINMPRLDGYETCRKLRSQDFIDFLGTASQVIPIVFITSNDTIEGRLKGFETGASDFITKPFLSGQLLDAVNKILKPRERFSGLKALVVDDDRLPKAIIIPALEQQGVIVYEAENGKAAFDIIRSKPAEIDIVVTDLEMPEMKGDALCHKIRKELGLTELPVIFLSAMPDKAVILDLFKIGATDYVVKPFLKEELMARLNVHLEIQVQKKILKKNIVEMNRLGKLKDDFLAICSHDLRAPLNGILGCAELLLGDDSVREDHKGYLSDIRESGKSLLSLIEKLLDVSRMQAENGSEMIPLSVVDTAQSSLNMLRHNAAPKGIELRLRNNAKKPVVYGEADSLARVFDNLISNAIKFTPAGGVVTVQIDHLEDSVVISFIDTGIGIAEDKIPHLFEKFSKASQSGTSGEKSAGLGLAITKELVDKLAGRIEVSSQIGKGSCFRVMLPTVI